jgi:SAM-dependent methyltransferase
MRDLRALGAGLALAHGDALVDLACGAGGPGRWVARESSATLTGIDLSAVAIERARESAAAERATFRRGSFEATGLPDASADGVMTVDALQYAPDKAAAMREMARILRPGGRLALTTFELDRERVEGLGVWDDPVGDYRPLLTDAGFDVVSYEQTDGWSDAVRGAYGAIVDTQEVLSTEMGEDASAALVLEASVTLQLSPYSGHVLVVATRR